jgi:hypothetical protein
VCGCVCVCVCVVTLLRLWSILPLLLVPQSSYTQTSPACPVKSPSAYITLLSRENKFRRVNFRGKFIESSFLSLKSAEEAGRCNSNIPHSLQRLLDFNFSRYTLYPEWELKVLLSYSRQIAELYLDKATFVSFLVSSLTTISVSEACSVGWRDDW